MAVFRHASQGVTVRNFWLCLLCRDMLKIDEILQGSDTQPWFLVVTWPQFSVSVSPHFAYYSEIT